MVTHSVVSVNTVVYGRDMKERLSKSDWLEFGLQSLANAGPAALKVDPMAKGLGVSRGSFYWHFKDITAFHDALAEHWLARSQSVAQTLRMRADPRDQLFLLMKIADQTDPKLETAIRVWAINTPKIAELVAKVDSYRIGVLTQLFEDMGCLRPDAEARGNMIYAAAIGRYFVFPKRDDQISDEQLNSIIDVLSSHNNCASAQNLG